MNLLLQGNSKRLALADGSIHMVITSPPYFSLRDYQVDEQLGYKSTPAAYIESLVEVFREVRRVLRDDGTLWVNLADSYNGSGGAGGDYNPGGGREGQPRYKGAKVAGLKPKDLIGIPQMFPLAMREDGWYWRGRVIWWKKNAMPESAKDRPSRDFEEIFLFSKKARYYFDMVAIEEPAANAGAVISLGPKSFAKGQAAGMGVQPSGNGKADNYTVPPYRHKRSVWAINTSNYKGAHFATFPPKLAKDPILAGTSEYGVCSECGAPYKRIVKRVATRTNDLEAARQQERNSGVQSGGVRNVTLGVTQYVSRETLGWEPTCEHRDAPVRPAIVLDPFNGAGSAGVMANQLGRRYVGGDLSLDYLRLAQARLAEKPKGRKTAATWRQLPLPSYVE